MSFHHLPLIGRLPDAEQFERQPGFLGSQYLEMVDLAGDQILAALAVLAEPEALPAVVHCTAGKDRTGVLCALVLSLVGVDEPTVVADYAISAQAMEVLRARLFDRHPELRAAFEEVDEVFSADPAQMERLLDHLRSRYGSVESYVAISRRPSRPGRRVEGGAARRAPGTVRLAAPGGPAAVSRASSLTRCRTACDPWHRPVPGRAG